MHSGVMQYIYEKKMTSTYSSLPRKCFTARDRLDTLYKLCQLTKSKMGNISAQLYGSVIKSFPQTKIPHSYNVPCLCPLPRVFVPLMILTMPCTTVRSATSQYTYPSILSTFKMQITILRSLFQR